MALVLADRVKETTTTTGTGTVTLLGASTGFQSFAVIGNANTTYYTITAQTGTEWEVGIGTYTSAGTLLARTTVLSSSNGGSAVNFSAGTKDVFVTYPSSRSIYADGAILTATNSSVLPTTSGGTGLTSFTANGVVYASSTSALATGSALSFDGTNLNVTSTGNTIASNIASRNTTSGTGAASQILVGNDLENDLLVIRALSSTYTSSGVNTASGGLLRAGAVGGLTLAATDGSGTIKFAAGGATEGMRLTSTGLGIGTTSPATLLEVYRNVNNNNAGLRISNANTGGYASALEFWSGFNGGKVNSLIYGQPNGLNGGELIFQTRNQATDALVDRVTIDNAGNVGIGTSSPAQTLHVKTSTSATPITLGVLSNATGLPALSFNGAYASTTMAGIYGNGATASSLYYEVPSGQSHFFGIADVTKMTLDSAGNLGLGVTPSAWDTYKAIQISSQGSLSSTGSAINVGANAYYGSGGYTYIANGTATLYQQNTGEHLWRTAASGTAGNAISFTQAMTLDASGNLMVGGTTALNTSSGRGNITIDGTSNSILNFGVGGVAKSYLFQNAGSFYITNLASAGGSVIFENNGSERMRIDSSGNVGIGTSSPATKLDVVGGSIRVNEDGAGTKIITIRSDFAGVDPAINVTTNNSLLLMTNNTQRFVIGTSGQFGIGATPSYGSSGQVLTSGGSGAAPTWASPAVGGFSAMTVITTSSNFTIPTGKTTLKVTVVGAGGGGGFGTAAAAGNGGNTTLASGTQSISTITGGYGSGGPTGSYYGGIGGVGSGGDLNFYGSDGHGSNNNTTGFSGNGGNSFLGGGGSSRGLVSSGNAEPGRIYGGGGGATYGGNGGGGGGTAIKYLTGMTPGNTLAITIGAGGAIGAGGSGNGGLGADGVVIIEY